MIPRPPRSTLFPYTMLFRSQLARRAPDVERAVANHRQAGGVIAAVLEPLQPFEQHRHHALVPDVADDSGHALQFFIIADGPERDFILTRHRVRVTHVLHEGYYCKFPPGPGTSAYLA